jgi:hypothetical protein
MGLLTIESIEEWGILLGNEPEGWANHYYRFASCLFRGGCMETRAASDDSAIDRAQSLEER